MVGITAIGTYIPQYRLKRDEIAKFWKGRSSGGEKAVAGYDEDTITLAVAATLDCLKGNDKAIDAFYFATTTASGTPQTQHSNKPCPLALIQRWMPGTRICSRGTAQVARQASRLSAAC